MDNIRTIIVDDEKKSRDGLQKLTAGQKKIEVVAVCKNGLEAIESIQELKPDLLLLDIQMPGISGFDVLNSIDHRPFIIFITAYDQFALKAFEHHALDYLLKPFTNERFEGALHNAQKLIANNKLNKSINSLTSLVEQLRNSSAEEGKIVTTTDAVATKLIIRSKGKIVLVNYENIKWIEAYDYYVKIHESDTHIVKDSLKRLGDVLPDNFMRVHKSAIVNITHLKTLEPLGHSEMLAKLTDLSEVKVSRNYKEALMAKLSISE